MLMLLSLILSGASTVLGSRLNLAFNQQAGLGAASLRASPGAASRPLYLRAERDAQILYQAKVALLAYAVSYADNYRPTGAGPGHMPCPDLDPPDDGNPRNDGPNPPCSRASRLVGRIPRLTTAVRESTDSEYNDHKVLEFYPLQTHLDHQPWYRIAGSFINNPGNRVVNPSSVSSLQDRQQRQIVATLMTPGPEIAALNQQRPGILAEDYLEGLIATQQPLAGILAVTRDHNLQSNDLVVPIYVDELLPLVVRRVAGFVRDMLYRYRDTHCPVAAAITETQAATITATDLPDIDVSAQSAAPVCFPYAAAPLDSTTQQDASVQSADELNRTASTLTECVPGLLAGRVSLVANDCESSLSKDGLWQGVDVARHWFVRNAWVNYFHYAVELACLFDTGHQCRVEIVLPDSQLSEPGASPESVQVSVVLPQ